MEDPQIKSNGIDTILLLFVFLLLIIGSISILSATQTISEIRYGDKYYYLWKHLFSVGVGITAMLIIALTDYKQLKSLSFILLAISLLMLLLVFVPGVGFSANGARRWLRLWPSSFQPSELAKVALLVFFADYIDRNKHRMREFRYGIMIPVSIILPFLAITIIQPDFGAAIMLGVITIGMILLGNARLTYISALLLLSSLPIYMLLFSTSYRMKRMICFLDPWREPYSCGYQLIQSFIAFGSGGLTGAGFNQGRQKLSFLPEVSTDFIFAHIGEEFGLIGTLVIIILFVIIITRGFLIAHKVSDTFGKFLALGITFWLGIQAIFNMAVATGIVPTAGEALPFVSYGHSAIFMQLIAVGILMNLSSQTGKYVNHWTLSRKILQQITMRVKKIFHRNYGLFDENKLIRLLALILSIIVGLVQISYWLYLAIESLLKK